LLNSSIESYNNNDSYGALYNLAYSKIRLNTAKSWFSLNGLLKGNLSYVFNQEDYSELAYTRIENAKTLLNYANSLGESYYSEYAQELIDSSMSAYNKGDIIYSLFQSLKSISNSNLALSLSGVNDNKP
jgi:predicted S18 family serine protease